MTYACRVIAEIADPRGRWFTRIAVGLASVTASACLWADDGGDYPQGDYLKHVKPILRQNCFACHGVLKQKAGLRLDSASWILHGGDSGTVITPGIPSDSLLLKRVTATDAAHRMPPEHEGDSLTLEQVRRIRTWIENGAPAPKDEPLEADPRDHWAFQPVVRPRIPVVENTAWIRNAIDSFLAQQHQQRQLVPQPEAARIELLRRLHLDLIGIPPTATEITAFENHHAPDWYERALARLMDDPRHGERWARHWMDIWRYSDWWGLGSQLRRSQKHIWHWRDWIIESLNDDMPYDEMVRLMLAADELAPNDLDKLRATGFLARNYWLFNRDQWMDETVEHVSKGFLGLTINCAKCHDHKYDPIAQTDFYRMRAFFEPYHVRLDVLPGQSDLTNDGLPCVYDGLPNVATYLYIRGQEKQPDKSTVMTPGVPESLTTEEIRIEPVNLPLSAWEPARRPWVIDSYMTAARENVPKAIQAASLALKKLDTAVKESATTSQSNSENNAATVDPAAIVQECQQELTIAKLAVDLAIAQLRSVERRADAMRAAWQAGEGPADNHQTDSAVAAIRAEREWVVVQRQHEVAVAKLESLRAKEDAQESAEKKLKEARDSLDKAIASTNADITAADQPTPLVGAEWTPTRFLDSTTDDPTVSFVPTSTGRRSALAKWIADNRNPLTARVAVNHLWIRHMGEPLVTTLFDFGLNGSRPTHPELLDWLAAELMDSGWSMKHLHRLITSSAAYRMSSSMAGGESNAAQDPNNRYWWRRVPIRIESQLVRDSLFAHAGTLDQTMGGPSVPGPSQVTSTRRSLYFFHSNNERNLFLTSFDEALVTECYRREQSIVPQQALALTNSRTVLDAAPLIARRLSAGIADEETFIRGAFAVLLGMHAGDDEVSSSRRALMAWRELPDGSSDNAEAHFVWTLINHNDFITLR